MPKLRFVASTAACLAVFLAACGGDTIDVNNLFTDGGPTIVTDASTDATIPTDGQTMLPDGATSSCTDGIKNGTEGDVDCGGSCPTTCVDGMTCGGGSDCTSGVCTSGTCATSTCTDTVKNGTETGVDCGGSCGTKCATGMGCGTGADCATGACQNNLCVAASCTDMIQNSGESDVDCGGTSTCMRCADNAKCTTGADCVDAVCSTTADGGTATDGGAGTCLAASCSDGVKNGTETGADCGGSCTTKCADSTGCTVDADCADGVCSNTIDGGVGSDGGAGVCLAPACVDGVKNGSETDVDCGGSCTTKCADMKGCLANADCVDKVCTGNACTPASCSDGVQNGTETGQDCGGSCDTATTTPVRAAQMCPIGGGCATNADCAGTSCSIAAGATTGTCGSSGADGALTVAALQTVSINANEYQAVGAAGMNTMTIDATAALTAGQTVLIHQTQGTGAGTYEYNTVQTTTTGTSVTLANNLANTYGTGAQIIVVPQYTTVSVAATGTLTAPAWNGKTGGILVFEASGAVTVALTGSITMNGKGYRGPDHSGMCFPGVPNRSPACNTTPYQNGDFGESALGPIGPSPTINGTPATGADNGAGGGGGVRGQDCAMGAGGGYGTAGIAGARGGNGNCTPAGGAGGGVAGTTAGAADLSSSFVLGGAGGEGGPDEDGAYPGPGGNGGGAILFTAASLTATGTISSNGLAGGFGSNATNTGCASAGGSGMGNGGAGAGGAIRILTSGVATLGAGLVQATGGTDAVGGSCNGAGGNGGVGRIQVRSTTTTNGIVGTTTPTFAP